MPPSCGEAMRIEGKRRGRREVDWVWEACIEGEWTPGGFSYLSQLKVKRGR